MWSSYSSSQNPADDFDTQQRTTSIAMYSGDGFGFRQT
jgi:hypothetical protein